MSDSSVMFQAQLSSVMEILFKAAVYEITKVVEGSFSHFRVEIAQVKKENESLRLRLQLSEATSTAEQCYGISHMGKTAPSVTTRSIGVQVCEEHTRKESGAGMKRKLVPVVKDVFGKEWCSSLWEAKEPRTTGFIAESTDSCPVHFPEEVPELLAVLIKEEVTDTEQPRPESLHIKEERSEVDLSRRDPQEESLIKTNTNVDLPMASEMKLWAETWREASPGERNICIEAAESSSLSQLDAKQKLLKKKRVFKQLHQKMKELWDLNVHCILYAFDGLPVVITNGTTAHGFAEKYTNVESNFALHCQKDAAGLQQGEPTRKELRNQVQELLNRKYAEAVGSNDVRLPYKQVDKTVFATGLPEGITLQKPSFYGKEKLKMILQEGNNLKIHLKEMMTEVDSVIPRVSAPQEVDSIMAIDTVTVNRQRKKNQTKRKGAQLVGRAFKYLWSVDTDKGKKIKWFPGVITGYNAKSQRYYIKYDNGEKDELDGSIASNKRIFRLRT
ncbi:uncharacterized protein LOC136764535 [Amia ocellicauda]|uniref:uncharacterized protein LOC136764535 n=1 Tax=Amia ocellicauda TaxID=2972642 RepID=UPI003463F8F6